MNFLAHMKVQHPANSEAWLTAACQSGKGRAVGLKALEPRLLAAYQGYDALIQNKAVEPAPSLFLADKELLNKSYSSAPESLQPYLQKRRHEHGLEHCPFCGNPFDPDTLDHFLPKDKWPEFSIYPNNLAPQCGGCGSKKWRHYYCDKDCHVKYIHPIYYSMLSRALFKVQIGFTTNSEPLFYVKIVPPSVLFGVGLKWFNLHMDKLNVKERAEDYCRDHYIKFIEKKCRKTSVGKVIKFMRLTLEMYPDVVGRDWKTALYKGMLSNKKFLQYLMVNC